jgi:hypothetical protein
MATSTDRLRPVTACPRPAVHEPKWPKIARAKNPVPAYKQTPATGTLERSGRGQIFQLRCHTFAIATQCHLATPSASRRARYVGGSSWVVLRRVRHIVGETSLKNTLTAERCLVDINTRTIRRRRGPHRKDGRARDFQRGRSTSPQGCQRRWCERQHKNRPASSSSRAPRVLYARSRIEPPAGHSIALEHPWKQSGSPVWGRHRFLTLPV